MPAYELLDVVRAAKAEDVVLSRTAARDARSLDYNFEQICDCLSQLEERNFRKTHPYNDGHADEYICKYTKRCSDGNVVTDDLYIKIRLINGQISLSVLSFHLPRF